MESYKEKYERLKEEFETYQSFSESQIQILNDKNISLEKNMDALVNIVEISKYINSYLSNENLITMINDMIIGILGATYSSIYLKEKDNLVIKATNINNSALIDVENEYLRRIENGKPFILNCKESLFQARENKKEIHSIIGVPIQIRDKFIGYIVVEHTLWNFFTYDHIKFISSIANQIAIAIENSLLYNEIQERAKRDPLLGIYNRRYFVDFIEDKIKNNLTHRFAIVMVDIDDFKKVNDTEGHQFGDEVLIKTVGLIVKNLCKEDIVARYGGEEIVIYIEEVDSYEEVFLKVEGIRKAIENNIINLGKKQGKVTASFGVSFYPDNGENIEQVLSVADKLLYRAKNSGKNKVKLYNLDKVVSHN